VSRFQRRKTKVTELFDVNYGFELGNLKFPGDEKKTSDSADHRKSADVENAEERTSSGSTVGRTESEQTCVTADGLHLAGPDASENLALPRSPKVEERQETADVDSLKNENKQVETSNAEKIAVFDDVLNEANEVDANSHGETGQKANELELITVEKADPFAQLPLMEPYHERPVFKGHTNYGFEFLPVLEHAGSDNADETRKQQTVASASGSDLAKPEVTSSTACGSPPPKKTEAARPEKAESATPETENEKSESEDAEEIAYDEEKQGDGSQGEAGQGEGPEGENAAAEKEENEEEKEKEEEVDPFAELPPMAPYQDPPVFRGHTNYGFELASWDKSKKEEQEQSEGDGSKKEGIGDTEDVTTDTDFEDE